MVMQVSSVHSTPSINSYIPMTLISVQTQVWLNLLQVAFYKCSFPLLIFEVVDTWSCPSDPKHSNLKHRFLVHSSGIAPLGTAAETDGPCEVEVFSFRLHEICGSWM
jgi:hypothetical protein